MKKSGRQRRSCGDKINCLVFASSRFDLKTRSVISVLNAIINTNRLKKLSEMASGSQRKTIAAIVLEGKI